MADGQLTRMTRTAYIQTQESPAAPMVVRGIVSVSAEGRRAGGLLVVVMPVASEHKDEDLFLKDAIHHAIHHSRVSSDKWSDLRQGAANHTFPASTPPRHTTGDSFTTHSARFYTLVTCFYSRIIYF